MKPIVHAIAAIALVGLLGACDRDKSGHDQALEKSADKLENRADAVRDSGEKKADAIEKQDPGMNSDATKNAADAVRQDSKANAASLEHQADQARDQKN